MIIDALPDVAAPLCAAAALLLLPSGVLKIVRPAAASTMLAALLPRSRRRHRALRALARVAGVAETVIGGLVLVVGGAVPAALLAAAYFAFAVVALRLVTAPQPVSCGCFGRADTPVTAGHVALNVAAVAVAATAAVTSLPRAGGVLDDGPGAALAGAVLIALVTWTAYLSITALPALRSARRLVETS